eukprot:12921974-Alexandrium_andersonii.AAC.1
MVGADTRILAVRVQVLPPRLPRNLGLGCPAGLFPWAVYELQRPPGRVHNAAVLPPAPAGSCNLLRLRGCHPIGRPRLHVDDARGVGPTAALGRPPPE